MAFQTHMAGAILFFLITWLRVSAGCDEEDVVVYKMKLKTLWSEERFPKDYPLYRPKAQWAQVFGKFLNLKLQNCGER